MSQAQYKVTKESYIGDEIVKVDAIVTYAGWPGSNLDPANAEAERIAERYAELKAAVKADPKLAIPKSPEEDAKSKAGKKAEAGDKDAKAGKK